MTACDRIIGSDEEAFAGSPEAEAEQEPRGSMSGDDIVGLIIAAVLLGYLLYALVAPEKL